MKQFILSTLSLFILSACAQEVSTISVEKDLVEEKSSAPSLDSLQVAYFASGCFWCVEAVYESVKGVEEAVSGYAGGEIENPTYAQVSSGMTKHAEAVKVYYDSTQVSFETLVDVFFASHDPSTLNQQGPDKGTQYRSIAFYNNEREKRVIEEKILTLLTEKKYTTITTEVIPFEYFCPAEDYHQDYKKKHPEDTYVKSVSVPRIKEFRRKMPNVLKRIDL